jgi:hypothetical protein
MDVSYAALALGLGWNELWALHWACQQPAYYIRRVQARMRQDKWHKTNLPWKHFVPWEMRGMHALAMPTGKPSSWFNLLWPMPQVQALCALRQTPSGIMGVEMARGNRNHSIMTWNITFCDGAHPINHTTPDELYQCITNNLQRMRKSCE